MFVIRPILFFCLLVVCFNGAAQSSVLSSGLWYKVAVQKSGVYKITFDQLKKMGFNLSSLNPSKLKIFGNGGGMLPQVINIARPVGLTELAIKVVGDDDGVFDKNDYILFYAEGADHERFDIDRNSFFYENNLYSEKNFYFITVNESDGKRIDSRLSLAGDYPVIDTFDDFTYYEKDEYSELKSGREWYGEQFDFTTERAFSIDVTGIVANTQIKMVSDVVGQAHQGSSFKISYDGAHVGEQYISPIPDSQYGLRGRHKRDTLLFNAAETSKPEIRYQYVKSGSGKSVGFLDYFLLTYTRKLALYANQTIFRSSNSLNQAISTYRLSATGSITIWDITEPASPTLQLSTNQSEAVIFSATSESLRKFIAFNTNIPSTELVGVVANQNLQSLSPPNLIIVSHEDFLPEALRLATHRQSHANSSVIVVTPQQIFNEFSSGRQDVTAIRDFVKHLYDKNPTMLKTLLLFGKCSYDYKDRIANNTNFVPTYESRNSLDPLASYASDDYFGFLENDEGNWGEGSPAQNHSLDIGVGRLPITTLEQGTAVVDKIIYYDTDKNQYGKWRKDVVFVSDDGNTTDFYTSTHQQQANTLAAYLENESPAFNTKKIFLGTYPKNIRPSGETIPGAKEDILKSFNQGSLIINYTGHGSEKIWADERVLTDEDIEELENKTYPFLVTATCEFGRHDDPTIISSAELAMNKPEAGCIGLVTTTRLVYSYSNFELNKTFYEALIQEYVTGTPTLGELFRLTKNNSQTGVSNRNFSLLGDPSMRLATPQLNVMVTEMKTDSGSDTLKALSTVHVKGTIQGSDLNKIENFNGVLYATLYDKETDFVTIGKNDPPFNFKQWYNALFRGKASVVNGEFEFTFIVPKNIAYEYDKGKLALYAADAVHHIDAAGSSANFKIGGSENAPAMDNEPPVITLYMGDETFKAGGLVSPNTLLLAKVGDESGINISNYGIGNAMVATLDNDGEVYLLSDYYESNRDNYKEGWIRLPLKDLSPGLHAITVRVWDVFNNPAQKTITFQVTDGENLLIEDLWNSPNPFEINTTLYFTHNRSGDDLDGTLVIYESTGRTLKEYNFTVSSSPYQVNLIELNQFNEFGKKLPGGLYLARLQVRSITNGSKTERITKLLVN